MWVSPDLPDLDRGSANQGMLIDSTFILNMTIWKDWCDVSNNEQDNLPANTRMETAADIAAAASSLIPWLGGPLSYVLGGYATGRRMNRISEAVKKLAQELKDFKSEASERYVQSEDFEELLDVTLRRIYEERSEQKREAYKNFLVHAVKYPGTPYDEQLRMVRVLEDMQFDHIRVLHAFSNNFAIDDSIFTDSPSGTLARRLPDMTFDHIKDLVDQLNDWRLIRTPNLSTTMTGRGAQELYNYMTPFGKQFLQYIVG